MDFLNLTTKYWPNIFRLDNKVVVVSGVGLIGSEVVRGLAEAGATVVFTDINEEKGKKLEEEYKNLNLYLFFKKMDIANEESVDNFLEECVKKFGRIDAWVNMAWPRTEDYDVKESLFNFDTFKKNINMHLGGYYLTSLKVAEIMKKQKSGSIVNFSSTYGITAPDFSIYEGTEMTNKIHYAANKGAINMLTKYISTLYGSYNVRSNVLAPGGVFDNQPEPFITNYINKTPLKRMARPEDIVGPVIFLVSDASSYVTGHILMVDGGWTIW